MSGKVSLSDLIKESSDKNHIDKARGRKFTLYGFELGVLSSKSKFHPSGRPCYSFYTDSGELTKVHAKARCGKREHDVLGIIFLAS